MTKKYPSEDEIERLAEHYEKLDDEDGLIEWEHGEPVPIDGCVRWRCPRSGDRMQ